MKTLTSSFYSK